MACLHLVGAIFTIILPHQGPAETAIVVQAVSVGLLAACGIALLEAVASVSRPSVERPL